MDTSTAIRSRRSIRKYQQTNIPDSHIHSILEAAMMAPSACNTRPWEFFVIKDENIRKQIATVSPYCHHLIMAPIGIIVCGKPNCQVGKCSPYWPQDCGAAIQNILLEALNLGYGSCWCGLYPSEGRAEAVQQLLKTDAIPMAVITIGVANEAPLARGHYDESRVHFI